MILDAAEKRFAERGYSGVAVREIAADAGLKNQASLYHHFKNKRAIYEAVLTRGIEPLIALIPGGANFRFDADTAEMLVDVMLDYLDQRPNLPRLIQRAGLDDAKYLRKALPRLLRPLYEEGLRMLSSAGGPWRTDELPHVAAGFYHLIFGYFANAGLLEAVLQHDPASAEAVARQRAFLKTAARKLLGTPVAQARL
jgi:AcrR family transcriptional regulator